MGERTLLDISWRKKFEISYFEPQPHHQGTWEFDLSTHQLYWSKDQYALYGYEPGELSLNDEFFILKTTHISDVKRITSIVNEAIKSHCAYNFKRRIIKNNGRLGFVETNAIVIRSPEGEAKKVLGTTIDLTTKQSEAFCDHNDPRYFTQLYTNYNKVIRYEIFRLIREEDTTNDLCQEVFLKAWHSMSQYDASKGELYTWLINIAKNHCKDYFKSRYFRSHQLTSEIKPETSENPSHELFDREKLYVRDLLLQLSVGQRELIELLFIQGYTQTEVAKIKNLPLGTIKSRSRAALTSLRSLASRNEHLIPDINLSA